jgi:hypothetical protein
MALALGALELEAGEDFWQLAQRCMATLAPARDRASVSGLINALDGIVPIHGDPEVAKAVLAPLTLDLMISNLGNVAAAATSDRLRVAAIRGAALNTQIEANEVICVVTSGGNLQMTHITSRAQPSLLDAIYRVLTEQVLDLSAR